MTSMENSPKELVNDYANGMTSDEANNWLNEHIQLPLTYILESNILSNWKRDQRDNFVFHPGTR